MDGPQALRQRLDSTSASFEDDDLSGLLRLGLESSPDLGELLLDAIKQHEQLGLIVGRDCHLSDFRRDELRVEEHVPDDAEETEPALRASPDFLAASTPCPLRNESRNEPV